MLATAGLRLWLTTNADLELGDEGSRSPVLDGQPVPGGDIWATVRAARPAA